MGQAAAGGRTVPAAPLCCLRSTCGHWIAATSTASHSPAGHPRSSGHAVGMRSATETSPSLSDVSPPRTAASAASCPELSRVVEPAPRSGSGPAQSPEMDRCRPNGNMLPLESPWRTGKRTVTSPLLLTPAPHSGSVPVSSSLVAIDGLPRLSPCHRGSRDGGALRGDAW